MSTIRRKKCSKQDVSKTNLSPDTPSTSSQPSGSASRRRRASPFRGFSDNVDQTDLARLTRIVDESRSSNEGGSCDQASGAVSKEKRKRMSLPRNIPTKQVKTSKNLDLKPEKENSIDLFKKAQAKANFEKKQAQSNKKEKKVCTIVSPCDNKYKSNKEFLHCDSKGGNFVNIFNNLQRGLFKPSVFDEIAEQVTLRSLRWFKVIIKQDTSDRRVTAMAWHPTNSNLFVSGGKGGTVVLYKMDEEDTFNPMHESVTFPGMGPGGTMENMKFNPKRSGLEICTASVDGTISSYNFDTFTRKPLIESNDPLRVWFCAVDIHQDGKSVYGGDNEGNLAIHHLDSGQVDYGTNEYNLHKSKSKIKHLEFCPRDPNLMVTSSLDRTVKLWDIRKLNGKKSYIEILQHDSGVSAAKFSRTDGFRLLTTDMYSELRVYKAPSWKLEHKLVHPHRCFQHLTVIRASWHPRADLFVVGRYPDPKAVSSYDDIRSVDIFSASSASLRLELTDTSKLITSLTEFNSTGSFLASSSGRTLYIWKERSKRP